MSNDIIKKLYSFSEFMSDVSILETKIRIHEQISGKKINIIAPVARGGLILGTVLSHRLKIPMRIIELSFRDNMTQTNSIEWLKEDRLNVLVVDDICDSGRTLNYISTVKPNILTAVLIQKELSSYEATYYAKTDTGTSWIDFWWE